MGIDLLEQGGICRLLIHLLDHPEGIPRSQYREPPISLGSRAANRDHLALFNAGLITRANHPTKQLFMLTEKGKKIALKLKEIDDIIN
jgi:hypothetical protein